MINRYDMQMMIPKEALRSSGKTLLSAALAFLVMTLIIAVLYTGLSTAVAQVFFPYQANGSIIEVDGKKYGSELLAQQYTDDTHMWGRIMNPNTATFSDDEGNPLFWSEPSNLSPASDEYEVLVAERVAMIRAAHPRQGDNPIPSDLVTVSGSGLDPHISPAAAEYQVGRLAQNTGKSTDEIEKIINQCTDRAVLGIFGQDRVSVLKVNLMLDGILS